MLSLVCRWGCIVDGGSGGGGGGWWWWGAAAVEFGASRTPVALVRGAAQHAPTSTSTRHLRHTAPPTRRPLHPHHPHLRNGHTSPVRVRVAPPAGYAAAAARRRAPLTPPRARIRAAEPVQQLQGHAAAARVQDRRRGAGGRGAQVWRRRPRILRGARLTGAGWCSRRWRPCRPGASASGSSTACWSSARSRTWCRRCRPTPRASRACSRASSRSTKRSSRRWRRGRCADGLWAGGGRALTLRQAKNNIQVVQQ